MCKSYLVLFSPLQFGSSALSKGLNECPICLPVGSDAGQDGSQSGDRQSQVEPQDAIGVVLQILSVGLHSDEPHPHETWDRSKAVSLKEGGSDMR